MLINISDKFNWIRSKFRFERQMFLEPIFLKEVI
jgi:hypothetical protein